MNNAIRLSLVKRLALFAPIETFMCLLSLGCGVYGIWGLAEFESDQFSSKITPLAYAFGIWPYIVALLMAAWMGYRAYEKSSV